MKKLYVVMERVSEDESDLVAILNTLAEAEELCLSLWQDRLCDEFYFTCHWGISPIDIEKSLKDIVAEQWEYATLFYVKEVAYFN